jgi:hypothetical protein
MAWLNETPTPITVSVSEYREFVEPDPNNIRDRGGYIKKRTTVEEYRGMTLSAATFLLSTFTSIEVGGLSAIGGGGYTVTKTTTSTV